VAGTGARPIDRSLRLAALEAGESGANLGQPRPATRVVGMAVGVGTGTGVGVGTGIGIIVSVGALLALRPGPRVRPPGSRSPRPSRPCPSRPFLSRP